MATIGARLPQPTTSSPSRFGANFQRKLLNTTVMTGITVGILAIFLIPFAYGVTTSLKTENQISNVGSPWWPASERTYNYEGQDYSVYLVPTVDGIQEWALVTPRREEALFVDPANPEAGLILWEGRWRTLERAWEFDANWASYPQAWNTIDFLQLIRNTVFYAVFSTIGAVSSSAVVAYGFVRFPIPRKGLLFIIVIATIILPPQVTLIPTYFIFNRLGWVGTWWPLIIPAFFANGYNIFLLRQFFMGIPKELDEAATIDGAGPIRIFWSIILPQSIPALTAVTLFHFFFAWNDFFLPLIYLAGKPELVPISVGLTGFKQLYTAQTNLIQASSLIAAFIPLVIFFFAQRVFMQGIVVTGVEK